MNTLLIYDALFLFLFLVFCFYVLKYNKKYKIINGWFIIFKLWCLLAIFVIETGRYISEEQRYGFTTGATIRYVVLILSFFGFFNVFLLIGNKKYDRFRAKIYNKRLSYIILTIIFIIITLLMINLMLTGIVLIGVGGITKFNYWDYSKIKSLKTFQNLMIHYSFILGCLYGNNRLIKDNNSKTIKRASVILLLYQVFYLVLQGNKFTANVYCILYFIIPIYFLSDTNITLTDIKDKLKRVKIRKSIQILCVFIFILVTLALVFYEYRNYQNPFSSFLERFFVLQGHTYWGTDLIYISQNGSTINHFHSEINELLHPTELHIDTGMRYLMQLIAPSDIVLMYIQNNINFTEAYPAIGLLTFGFFGTLVFQVFLALLFSLIVRYMYSKVKNTQFARATITSKILYDLYHFFSMGEFSYIFNIRNVEIVILLIFIELACSVLNMDKKYV